MSTAFNSPTIVAPIPVMSASINVPMTTIRITGAIRKIKPDKGYGFIAGDDGLDYFFHWSAMEMTSKNFRDLKLQERVDFFPITIAEGKRRATQIRAL